MGRETTQETTVQTPENSGFAWSGLVDSFTNAVGDGWAWAKEKLTSAVEFNNAASNTAPVEPDAVMDMALFANATHPGQAMAQSVVQTFAVPDKPQAVRIDENTIPFDSSNYNADAELLQINMAKLGASLDPEGKFRNDGVDGYLGNVTKGELQKIQKEYNANLPEGAPKINENGVADTATLQAVEQMVVNLELEPATEKDLSTYESAGEKVQSFVQSAFDAVKDAVIPDSTQGQILANLGNPLDNMNVSSSFGMRNHPEHGDYRMHKGTDYAVPTGTPVYAMQDGEVIAVKDDGTGYGMMVKLDHGEGVQTWYSHLSNYDNVSVGDQVEKGQEIALSGNSGTSTGAHLDLSLRVDGRAVDVEYVLDKGKIEPESAPTTQPTTGFAPA